MTITDGLYLNQKTIPTSAAPIVTDIPTDHIVVIDCSGSMYNELPKIRQQLKNKLAMMLKEDDTVSIVWFSSKGQFGLVVEGVPLRTAVDLTGVHRAIDQYLRPMGLTGFVEPLEETARVIERLRKPGRAVNLFFMSDGHDNQWSKDRILQVSEKLQTMVSSAAVVEYGWYCNRPLMVQMAERLGATELLAETFPQYEPIFETAMTKKMAGTKKIEVELSTPAKHGFAFTIYDGEIITFAVDDRRVLVSEGLPHLYWFSELPGNSSDTMTYTIPALEPEGATAYYAGLIPLTQRMLSTDIFRVLKVLGDVRLIRQFGNCFGKQAYVEFQNTVTEAVFDPARRLLEGYNPNEVPAEDAYTVIDLLYALAADDGNLFYPSHEAFNYERTGRKALQADAVLSEAETTRIGQIAQQLPATRDPQEVVRLQQELSGLVQTKHSLEFKATDPNAGYPVSSLVLNEERPNISAQVRIPGTVELPRKDIDPNTFTEIPEFNLPGEISTSIVRNYTIVRDGIRNVKVLPVSLTETTHAALVKNGVLADLDWQEYFVYEIDLVQLPLINRKMVKAVSAKEMFQTQYDLLCLKGSQKVFKYYHDEHFPSMATTGFTEQYGPDAAAWLADLGIKDYGFSPKVELAEATESYYGKELKVSIKGLSSLPSVKSVLDKRGKKKLTNAETLLVKAIEEVEGFLSGAAYTSLTGNPQHELLRVWLTSRTKDTISQVRRTMRALSEIKFSIIVGQVWFNEFESLDENSLTMALGGNDLVCTANLNEVEIKV